MTRRSGPVQGDVLVIGDRPSWLVPIAGGLRRYCRRHDLAWRLVPMTTGEWAGCLADGFLASRPLLGAVGLLRDEHFRWLAQRGLPGVTFATRRPPADQALVQILPDDAAIGQLAARFFAERGYRHLGLIGDRRKRVRAERYRGAEAAARTLGLRVHRYPGPGAGDHLAALERWVRAMPKPLATFHFVDGAAAWFAEFCRHVGIRVPAEVAILGAHDDPQACGKDGARLSSVVLPWVHIGMTAALELHRLACGRSPARRRQPVRPLLVRERDTTGRSGGDDPVLGDLLAAIERAPGRDWTPAAMAAAAGLSRSALFRHCRARLDATPAQLLRGRRLLHAQRLLLDDGSPVAEVAARCGFPSLSAFSKAFKRHVGLSPQHFREQGRLDRDRDPAALDAWASGEDGPASPG